MRLLLFLLLPVMAQAADDWRNASSIENGMLYWNDAVYVRGRWATSPAYALPRTPNINTVQVRCSRSTMTCVESVAHLEQLRRSGPESPPLLSVYSFTYEVKAWDAETLTATRVNPHGEPVDESLTIGMKSGVMQKVWRARLGQPSPFQPSEQTAVLAVNHPYETPFAR